MEDFKAWEIDRVLVTFTTIANWTEFPNWSLSKIYQVFVEIWWPNVDFLISVGFTYSAFTLINWIIFPKLYKFFFAAFLSNFYFIYHHEQQNCCGLQEFERIYSLLLFISCVFDVEYLDMLWKILWYVQRLWSWLFWNHSQFLLHNLELQLQYLDTILISLHGFTLNCNIKEFPVMRIK